MPTNQLRAYIRHWFWEVHEWVNMTLSKPSFVEADLEGTYSKVKLRNILTSLDVPMNRAIRLTGNNIKKYSEWKGKYQSLLAVFGL